MQEVIVEQLEEKTICMNCGCELLEGVCTYCGGDGEED